MAHIRYGYGYVIPGICPGICTRQSSLRQPWSCHGVAAVAMACSLATPAPPDEPPPPGLAATGAVPPPERGSLHTPLSPAAALFSPQGGGCSPASPVLWVGHDESDRLGTGLGESDELDYAGDGTEYGARAPARSELGAAGDVDGTVFSADQARIAALAAVADPSCWYVVCNSSTSDVTISTMQLVQCDNVTCNGSQHLECENCRTPCTVYICSGHTNVGAGITLLCDSGDCVHRQHLGYFSPPLRTTAGLGITCSARSARRKRRRHSRGCRCRLSSCSTGGCVSGTSRS